MPREPGEVVQEWFKNGIGLGSPNGALKIGVVVVDAFGNRLFQLSDALEHATAKAPFGDLAEPTLDRRRKAQ